MPIGFCKKIGGLPKGLYQRHLDELSGLIKSIKAQKILVLIDTCKSGAVLIAFRGFEDRKALSQLSRSTGVHIVAASTKDQFAAEVQEAQFPVVDSKGMDFPMVIVK